MVFLYLARFVLSQYIAFTDEIQSTTDEEIGEMNK